MQTDTQTATAAARQGAAWQPWARWFAPAVPRAVTAVALGDRCIAARVEAGAEGEAPRLAAVAECKPEDLRGWRERGLFKASRPVLVLRAEDRHLQTLDRPDVPEAELPLAARWPLAEALEADPAELLATAVAMPRINDAAKPMMLGVAARIEPVRAHLKRLADVGIKVRHIDVMDTALRGMALLHAQDTDGRVVAAFIGGDICIGLVWQGRFCALRSLALPVRKPRDEGDFEEHLALHIQRTADLFERQATQLAIRHVLASMPSLPQAARESVRASLPLDARLFDIAEAMEMTGLTREQLDGDNDLQALACVAAARLLDATAPEAAEPAAAEPSELAA